MEDRRDKLFINNVFESGVARLRDPAGWCRTAVEYGDVSVQLFCKGLVQALS